jgi:hypothetical protein
MNPFRHTVMPPSTTCRNCERDLEAPFFRAANGDFACDADCAVGIMNADHGRIVQLLAALINDKHPSVSGGGSVDALIRLGTHWSEFYSKLDIVGRAV